jgi:hypothetical protein
MDESGTHRTLKVRCCDTCAMLVPLNSGDLIVDSRRFHLCGRCKKIKLDRIVDESNKAALEIVVNLRETNALEGTRANRGIRMEREGEPNC